MSQLHTADLPGHYEEETQNTNSQMTLKCIKVKQPALALSLSLSLSLSLPQRTIAKQETTLNNAQQSNDQI